MRRVLVQEWVSTDGMAAGPGGEDDVFAAAGEGSAASERHNARLLRAVDEVLLGRRTYESFVRFWPDAQGEAMAEAVNALPKTVASTSLAEAPWGRHAPARVVPDAVAHVRARRHAGDGTTVVWGSLALVRALLRASLVDELELFVAPVLLGTGTPLLGADEPPVPLDLAESEAWPGGVVRLRYAVAR